MTVTLNLPPDIEPALLAEANARGLTPDDAARDVLLDSLRALHNSPVVPSQPRISRLWELRKGVTLGESSINELIAEGRE